MTDRELMQQALEALENVAAHYGDYWEDIIAALRERLAQPEQEPVALETVYDTIIYWDETDGKRSRRELARRIVALYTTPPRREWQAQPEQNDLYQQMGMRREEMTDKEIMQQALEALNSCRNDWDHIGGEEFRSVSFNDDLVEDAKAVLNERLAQPYYDDCGGTDPECPLGTHWEGCEEVHPECKKA